MEHFPVIQSLIRAGLEADSVAFSKQTARLRARLEKEGAAKQVASIDRLLSAAADTRELIPSRVEVSRAKINGEQLTPEIHAPIDRETGAQLCDVEFPTGKMMKPVFCETVQETIDGVLEEWTNAIPLKAVGVEPTRSLLIYGPPGTGKTLSAHYLAGRMNLPLVTARIDGLISSFLGTTARNIANLFQFANRYACILLLDEFDALAKLRDDPQEIGEIKRVVNTLLQNLDQRRDHGMTIAITNHDRLLDLAVWRRFETHLHIGEPEFKAREQLITRFLVPVEADPAIIRIFSYVLPGQSGADLERICASVKRSVVLNGEVNDKSALFNALSSVLARMPHHDHEPARILAQDREAFISLIANDQNIDLKQIEIGPVTGFKQARISELKKLKRHEPLMEAYHAQ